MLLRAAEPLPAIRGFLNAEIVQDHIVILSPEAALGCDEMSTHYPSM
jgi:hypothetical protein